MSEYNDNYWDRRSTSIYLYAMQLIVRAVGADAKSMIDVGSANCPYLDWFDWIQERTSLDIDLPYRSPGINSVKADFLTWAPDKKYDVATCLQVMEHVPNAEEFAQRLLALAPILIVSVPYKWKAGRTPGHVHDPVDRDKVFSWFKREPNFSYICTEVTTDSRRLIHVYENHEQKWASLRSRARLLDIPYPT